MVLANIEKGSGLVRFFSKESVRAYIEAMLEYNKQRLEEYGAQLSSELRGKESTDGDKQKPQKDAKKNDKPQKTDVASGLMKVYTTNTSRVVAELTLQLVDEYKARVEALGDILKTFGDVESVSLPGTVSYTMFIVRGVPKAIVVESSDSKRETFNFSGAYKIV